LIGDSGGQSALGLPHQTRFQLPIDPIFEPAAEVRRRRPKTGAGDRPGRRLHPPEASQWGARNFQHLQRSDNANRIAAVDLGAGVETGEHPHQLVQRQRLELAAALGLGRDLGQREPVQQSANIEHRPALDDRQATARTYVIDLLTGGLHEVEDVVGTRRIDEVDQVVRDLGPLRGRGLVGCDLEALVGLA
jgi:hypothetical protein